VHREQSDADGANSSEGSDRCSVNSLSRSRSRGPFARHSIERSSAHFSTRGIAENRPPGPASQPRPRASAIPLGCFLGRVGGLNHNEGNIIARQSTEIRDRDRGSDRRHQISTRASPTSPSTYHAAVDPDRSYLLVPDADPGRGLSCPPESVAWRNASLYGVKTLKSCRSRIG